MSNTDSKLSLDSIIETSAKGIAKARTTRFNQELEHLIKRRWTYDNPLGEHTPEVENAIKVLSEYVSESYLLDAKNEALTRFFKLLEGEYEQHC